MTWSRTVSGRGCWSLLEDAVDSEYESAKISARSKRAAAANAAAGRPHGHVPYGYRRVYDPVTRRLVAQEPEPGEATVIGELFERLEAGHSLRSIEAHAGELLSDRRRLIVTVHHGASLRRGAGIPLPLC